MRRGRYLGIFASLAALSVVPLAMSGGAPAKAAAPTQPMHVDCEYSRTCLDVQDQSIFDQYTGHDEPSTLFYSNTPGSGNRMQYNVTLPTDPSPSKPTTKSYQFELNGALWFGLALCDTTSYPEQVSTCTPDSDSNITSTPATHPGTAFLELQLYPPGWIPWPTWAAAVGASSCDPTRWCAAMNVDSLLEDPVNGTIINSTCGSQLGVETVNFAFLTHSGVSQAPANPKQSTLTTFTPDPNKDLFMNSGDNLSVSIHDTPDGLQTTISDMTSGESGSMTASAANGFGHIAYTPTGTSCTELPYDFHPMYSTSSPSTRVPWAAHSYNVSFASEIGHFQTCTGPVPVPATEFGSNADGVVSCPAGDTENAGTSTASPADGDDNFCFPGSEALTFHVTGCTDTNSGFDGLDYQPVYPDGNRALHPSSFKFSSPLTGTNYNLPYSQMGFEADLPAIEGTCHRATGIGCTLIPTTDQDTPANFYTFFSTVHSDQGQDQEGSSNDQGTSCVWQFGNDTPGTIRDFDKNAQYDTLLFENFLRFGGGGATILRTENFRQIIDNPC